MVIWLARRPQYIPLFFAIGWFLVRAPRMLADVNVRSFVRQLRGGSYPRGTHEAINAIAAFWLIHFFPDRNTCYARALTLYRFLDERDGEVRLHLGIEPKRHANDRLRGHAWVSLRGEILEGPREAYEGNLCEIALDATA